ncbi:LysE family translocator [Oceanisphaera avium]|uniref:Threonine transporter RhtB n=1 Tax=Oceanisphaera avium TaxID=1903694 RepID=A0A1Y0D1A8_9GAMM|nr:threonine transporter RhtB [Oceanisphaera avium]
MVFIPTFFFVSITPGMCMTLALSLGMTVGVRRALWMMLGELVGVGLVACLSVLGVAAIMLQYPLLFQSIKYGGGLYLAWLGIQLWRSKGKLALSAVDAGPRQLSISSLVSQGFITAIANPKGWAFFIALLPPFIDPNAPLLKQLILLISTILLLEFSCLLLYASGGKTLSRVLQQKNNVKLMNRLAGTLMLGVAFWLALG